MSEYWVSKKKYFCKYCEIYIADDAPSKQHHENGLRHKGNVDRFIRGLYKAGEKQKKDLEEEKREMARVDLAARAAFAQDVSSGHAKASSGPVASTSSGSRKPPTKPSNPFANYTTADQLGYTDPDAEILEIKKSEGTVGQWEIVEATAPTAETQEDTKPNLSAAVEEPNNKRPAAAPPEEDDTRTFKLRKKSAAVGLGETYDPGLLPIKLKKKEETPVTPEPSTSASTSATTIPKWTSITLKPKDTSLTTSSSSSPALASEQTNGTPIPPDTEQQPAPSRWAKVQWRHPTNEEETSTATQTKPSSTSPTAETSTPSDPSIKTEEGSVSIQATSEPPIQQEQSAAGLFKKRKAPSGVGRGRR